MWQISSVSVVLSKFFFNSEDLDSTQFHRMGSMSQVTCGDHVKWITDENSRKDRSVSKGETMSKENGRDLKEES